MAREGGGHILCVRWKSFVTVYAFYVPECLLAFQSSDFTKKSERVSDWLAGGFLATFEMNESRPSGQMPEPLRVPNGRIACGGWVCNDVAHDSFPYSSVRRTILANARDTGVPLYAGKCACV